MAQKEQTSSDNVFAKVISHAKEYGFIFQSSEIYDGLQAVYDYGQQGVELKNNIKQLWWKSMTQLHDNIVGLDSAIFMHPTTWKASGHVDGFNDPMIDNLDSKKRYRADVLIEDRAAEYENEGDKAKADALLQKMGALLEAEDLEGVRNLIIEENIVCPVSGSGEWTEVRQFNLMFSTEVGSVAEDATKIYLRPETAQGIFVNFLNVQKTGRMKIPFGIAQIGKAFRNEIVARQFIFRMREFEQMEMQFFVRPGTQQEWFDKWKAIRMKWHQAIGLGESGLKYKVHDKLAHYADAAEDIEFQFPFGSKEIEGIHSRTDFDLKSHMEHSRKKISYFDEEIKESYIPYVVETSVGCDRTFLAVLCNAYREEEVGEGDKVKTRTYLKFDPCLAPIKAAILPLVKKDGLAELAQELHKELSMNFKCIYEANANIGKRYTRQDLIGTPFCITVDHQTLEDGTVTLRHRDSMEQERIHKDDLRLKIRAAVSMRNVFEKL